MVYPIPRLPVLDWTTFSGTKLSAIPCLLAHPNNQFTNSGRASILLALEMLGIGRRDKVLVPTYHCPTMIAPIVAVGAIPIFYPLNANGAPRLDWIKRANSIDVRALLVAHFFGLPQPLADVREWCNQNGVRLIEDCAHALFGASDDRAIGSWGDLSIASLTKFLPVPEGGCLVANITLPPIPSLRRPSAISQLKAGFDIVHAGANHGRLKGLGILISGLYDFLGKFKRKNWVKSHEIKSDPSVSEGFTIDTVQSHRTLTHASRWIACHASRERIVSGRREKYAFFTHAFSGLAGMHPLLPDLPINCAPYVFPLWVDHPDPGYSELRRLEFPVSRWDRLWPKVAVIEGDCGIDWSRHVLQLACHQDLTSDELQRMVNTVKQIYGEAGR